MMVALTMPVSSRACVTDPESIWNREVLFGQSEKLASRFAKAGRRTPGDHASICEKCPGAPSDL